MNIAELGERFMALALRGRLILFIATMLVANGLTVRVQAAPGDVVSAAVEPNGWVLDVTVVTPTNNTVFNLGFTNQVVGGATIVGIPPGKVLLNMTSLGFDDNAQPTTFPRNLYGTRPLRFPYGTNGQTQFNFVMDVTTIGGNSLVRLALSDYVYLTDSNLTVNVGAGWYGNAAVTGLVVTNNSTNLAGRVVANWSRPPFQRITNNVATVGCVAFGHGAQSGRPVRCVQFWAVDEANTSSPTNTVLNPIIDSSQGDALPVIEYVGNIDCSNLAPSNRVTVHFAAYPWIGDTNSALNTSDGRYAFPSLQAAPMPMFLDRLNNYPVQIAVVSPTGSDASGVVVAASSFNTNAPPSAFATTGAAALAIARTNAALYGSPMRENGAGIMYLQPGSYNYGASSLIGLTAYPKTWMTVAPFPGVARSQVTIANAFNSSANFVSQLTRIYNCTFLCTNTTAVIGQTDFLWIDHCLFSSNSTLGTIIDNCTNWYVTSSVVQDIPQGLMPAGIRNSNLRLIRGNDISGMNHSFFPSTVVGNLRANGTNGVAKGDWTYVGGHESQSYPIIAFNKLMCENGVSGGDLIKVARAFSQMLITNGAAVVQNVIEQVGESNNAVRCLAIGESSATVLDTNYSDNVFCWNNTVVGQRVNWLENAGGGTNGAVVAQRNNASLLNNVFDQLNAKDDLDYTPNGIRIGNWPVMFGVGAQANTDLDPAFMDGGWHWSWFGINSYSNHNMSGVGPNSGWATCFNFVDRESGTVQNAGVANGNGDYHLRTNSPLWQLKTQWVLPYDLDGNPRTAADPPGAFASAPAKPCVLQAPTYATNAFSVNLQTQTGSTYYLECLADLTLNSWQPVTNTGGNGAQQTLFDALPVDPRRYYRVRITSP
jgi:hypothetical protein